MRIGIPDARDESASTWKEETMSIQPLARLMPLLLAIMIIMILRYAYIFHWLRAVHLWGNGNRIDAKTSNEPSMERARSVLWTFNSMHSFTQRILSIIVIVFLPMPLQRNQLSGIRIHRYGYGRVSHHAVSVATFPSRAFMEFIFTYIYTHTFS